MTNKKVTDILPPKRIEKPRKATQIKTSKIKTATGGKKGLIFSLFFLVLLGIFGYFTPPHLWGGAEIEIWPETETLNLETKLTIDSAEVFQKEKTLAEVFQSSGKVLKEEKAEGLLKVYNEYSTSPQVLVATTRFVSTDGKVFRIPIRVVIPAGRYEGGRFVRGEIDIKVIADEAGPDYNIGPTTFSIPGFAGTDRYTKFYAKSFQPMTGGFREEVSKATKEDLSRAEDSLTQQAKKECEELLKNELQSEEISSKFYYFLDKFQTEIVQKFSSATAEQEIKEFKFQVKVKCKTLLFQKEEFKNFAKELIINRASQQRGEGEDENEFLIANQIPQEKKGEEDKSSSYPPAFARELYEESLKIDYSLETIDLNSGKITLSLNISGKIYSEVDTYNFKNALLGKSLLETKLFLENQPNIIKVSINLWPFWLRKIPEDLDKIKINIRVD